MDLQAPVLDVFLGNKREDLFQKTLLTGKEKHEQPNSNGLQGCHFLNRLAKLLGFSLAPLICFLRISWQVLPSSDDSHWQRG